MILTGLEIGYVLYLEKMFFFFNAFYLIVFEAITTQSGVG